jgi:glycosyltransferase involved in cell wall biosynthesis
MPLSNAGYSFSVIICAFTEKRLADLIEAVHSIKSQTCPAQEIIVVIDHNQALLETARACLENVTVIENSAGQGASGARNSGAAIMKGDILAFIDDDAVAEPDWLEHLSIAFAQENVLAAGGRIEPLWLSSAPAWFPEEFYWVIGASYRGLPVRLAPVRNLWSGNMAVRRDAFEAVGGFRAGFGKVGSRSSPEDTDFCIRLLERFPQKTILFTPEARVHHKVPAYRATWKFFLARCYNEGLGKVLLSSLVGVKTGMSSERSHMARALPQGVLRGIGDTLFHRDPSGLLRAGAIIMGLAAAASGYLVGLVEISLSKLSRSRQPGKVRKQQDVII